MQGSELLASYGADFWDHTSSWSSGTIAVWEAVTDTPGQPNINPDEVSDPGPFDDADDGDEGNGSGAGTEEAEEEGDVDSEEVNLEEEAPPATKKVHIAVVKRLRSGQFDPNFI